MSTWQFDIDIHFYAQYGIRRSQDANTVVHNLPWLWIIILCLPIKGFANNFHHVNELYDNDACISWDVPVAKCKTVISSLHQQLEILMSCPIMACRENDFLSPHRCKDDLLDDNVCKLTSYNTTMVSVSPLYQQWRNHCLVFYLIICNLQKYHLCHMISENSETTHLLHLGAKWNMI